MRCRGSTAAASLACRTCSGVREPVTLPVSTSATTAGWRPAPGQGSYARSRTRTPLVRSMGQGIGARQDPLSSRAACSFCHAGDGVPTLAPPLDERAHQCSGSPWVRRRSVACAGRRGPGAEGQVPVLLGLAVDVEHPLVALAGLAGAAGRSGTRAGSRCRRRAPDRPGGPISASPVISIGCGPCGPGRVTGSPSCPMSRSRRCSRWFARSQGTSSLTAIAEGARRPVTLQPPPLT